MTVEFDWQGISACSSVSPEIRIANVPAETRFVDIQMVDLDFRTFNHGGGTIAYSGHGIIEKGALPTYAGPCPPGGITHRYEFTVHALNEDKTLILGHGKSSATFPPVR
ncbi:hypothetical protein ACFQ4K_14460 [Tistrella bauzanensis]